MEMRRHFTLDDRAASVYQYVPLEVPSGASAFTVTLAYDRSAAVVDLGLDGPDRFCGWSGGERSTVTVAATWAMSWTQASSMVSHDAKNDGPASQRLRNFAGRRALSV